MALSLNKRQCKLGGSINTRTEKHGDEDVPAVDIPIVGMLIEKDELAELFDDRGVHAKLFDTKVKPPEPAWPIVSYFPLKPRFEKCALTLYLGADKDDITKVILNGGKIKGVSVTPQTGGLCEIEFTYQCTPDAEQVAQMFTWMNHDISASVRFGKVLEAKKAQPQLPLEHKGGEGEPEKTGTEEAATEQQTMQ